jgi:hypothetical protein
MMYKVHRFLPNLLLMAFLGCQGPPPAEAGLPAEALSGPRERLSGTVEAALAAGPYTYFRLHVGEGDDRWVVVSGREHRDAARLTVDTHGRQRSFVSRRLDRTFDELYFGSIPTDPSPGER